VASVCEGHEIEVWAAAVPGAPPLLPFPWQRLLQEVKVTSELLLPIKEGVVKKHWKRDKRGRVLMKPVREFLLTHPVAGPMVQQQEAAERGKPDVTYAQIAAVRAGVAAGAL
jgi:hypothetical protein